MKGKFIMNSETYKAIESFNGKKCIIDNFLICSTGTDCCFDREKTFTVKFQIHLVYGETVKNFEFYDVTSITLNFGSTQMVVEGFEVIDKVNDQWEQDRRYYLHDYESDSIAFYCRDIALV